MAEVTETTQVAARVPVDLLKQLEVVAKAKDRTISYEVRQAIKAHVETFNDSNSKAKAS